ncbi:UNVERIFIED_CONTAM: Flavanone 3-dioxygenase [Sesamum angustifolium]|uniref:Flavanone 3-dioxygenase n=1 Tax=Sesamum angustifolium TaxID=2727405 RepID=A0AAW2L5L0_9LAMI
MAPQVTSLAQLAEENSLHQKFIRDEDERPKVAYDQFSDDIPVISLAGIGESGSQRAEICRKIVAACEEWGIFQVVDHGIDSKLIDDMTRLAREFFALPAEEKLRFDMSGGKKGGFIVSSHLQGEAVQDWREIVTYFSYPVKARDYSRWPDKPAGWRVVTEAYSEQLMGLGCKLLEVLSEAMGLEKDALSQACLEMDQKVVVNYYPKCPQPNLTLGLKRHTDPGTITLLLQDQVGGLQATRDGGKTWITVQPVEGAFVVNLGDHGHRNSKLYEQREVQECGSSGSSELKLEQIIKSQHSQNPAPNAIVYPLKLREGEKAVMEEGGSRMEMYKRKMSKDLELARLKKLAKEKRLQEEELQREKQA